VHIKNMFLFTTNLIKKIYFKIRNDLVKLLYLLLHEKTSQFVVNYK